MGWKKINVQKYIAEVKRNMHLEISDDIIAKDLLLTLLLAEFEKEKRVFNQLIFKGGTLLSRNYLKYHRFSEDLDFVYFSSNQLRELSRKKREKVIKEYIDYFVLALKKISDVLDLDFTTDRSDTKYCTVVRGRSVYVFRVYYEENNYIKIEINFIEKTIYAPNKVSIKAITDFFDSKELMFILGLRIENFEVLSYSIKEIILEKYRALLTRQEYKERDLFDLFLIPRSLEVDIKKTVEKIESSYLIRRDLDKKMMKSLELLKNNNFFRGEESVRDLAIVKYDIKRFENFKKQIVFLLISICEKFLENLEKRLK